MQAKGYDETKNSTAMDKAARMEARKDRMARLLAKGIKAPVGKMPKNIKI